MSHLPNQTPATESGEPSPFYTTCWTDVLSAAQKDTQGEAAFSRLYQDYWTPVYRYELRRGYAHAQAEEITSGMPAKEGFSSSFLRESVPLFFHGFPPPGAISPVV